MDRPIRLTSLTGVGESRFRVEILDDDVLVLDTHLHLIHRIHGTDVDDLLAGRPSTAAGHLPAESLPALGAALDGRPVARRRVLMSGGALAASGIVTLGLPFAAAAASRAIGVYPPDADVTVFNGNTTGNETYNHTAGVSGGTVRILLRATNGGNGGTSQAGVGGAGSYVAVTLSSVPTSGGYLRFRPGLGGDAGPTSATTDTSLFGGDGGQGVGVAWVPSSGSLTWLAVAGGGGGAGGGVDGGDYGQPGGGGTRGGGAGTTSSAGAAGTGGHSGIIREAKAGGGPVTDPAAGQPAIGSRSSVSIAVAGTNLGGSAEISELSSRQQGGGGGAGYYQGGGGLTNSVAGAADGGGGGGGSNYFLTTPGTGRPYVSSVTETANGAPFESGVFAYMFF
jgi:hypothetical protein